jgi:LmbE family N-acetylglucosaminyl deacetylase
MAAERTELHVNVLTGLIEQGMPVVVLSPHLHDAVLSCRALLTYAAGRTSVTVVTLFTEPGQPPYTMSARRYLRQAGARDADAVFSWRRAQDRAALEPLGITCVHAGLTEAPLRRPAGGGSRLARLRPDLAQIYPYRRPHVTSGRSGSADAGTLRETREIIQRVAGSGLSLVLAPLGVGGHVDHILVRAAAQRSGAPVAYYRDFPGDRRDLAVEAFIYRHDLVETRWPEPAEAEAEPIRAYGCRARKGFPGADVPAAPEVFFSAASPSATASSAWWRLGVRPGPAAEQRGPARHLREVSASPSATATCRSSPADPSPADPSPAGPGPAGPGFAGPGRRWCWPRS